MVRLIIGLILGIVAVVFAIQNTATVDYSFLVWTLTAPRALVVLVVFLAGLLVGFLVTGFRRRRRR